MWRNRIVGSVVPVLLTCFLLLTRGVVRGRVLGQSMEVDGMSTKSIPLGQCLFSDRIVVRPPP